MNDQWCKNCREHVPHPRLYKTHKHAIIRTTALPSELNGQVQSFKANFLKQKLFFLQWNIYPSLSLETDRYLPKTNQSAIILPRLTFNFKHLCHLRGQIWHSQTYKFTSQFYVAITHTSCSVKHNLLQLYLICII